MKLIKLIVVASLLLFFAGCGEKGKKKNRSSAYDRGSKAKSEVANTGLSNKGVGPVKELILPEAINKDMVKQGEELFNLKCTACHRTDKRFIGPNPTGILKRRSPEWIMNMILDPEKMVKEDPDAKKLLIEYNGSPMANQNLTEKEARTILEFFRTLN